MLRSECLLPLPVKLYFDLYDKIEEDNFDKKMKT